LLFTFYMVPDPGTTPSAPRRQALFGASVAAAYGLLLSLHVTFAPFFGLCLVCGVRGIALHLAPYREANRRAAAPSAAPALAAATPDEVPASVASAPARDGA
ncbi:MAG TPA: enediyne biosynthesis protein UnbU, partial [Candidatus Methylomirabilis sp.]|nr:enediyne biosynthesis protein UnbU [Candidatus Methylomirabilis sp.]